MGTADCIHEDHFLHQVRNIARFHKVVDVLCLKNKWCYPQSAFTHNQGTIIFSLYIGFSKLNAINDVLLFVNQWHALMSSPNRSRQKDTSSPVGQLLQKSLHIGDEGRHVPQVWLFSPISHHQCDPFWRNSTTLANI